MSTPYNFVLGLENSSNISDINLNMAGEKRKKKSRIVERTKLKRVTATSFNPTPRKEQVTRVKAPVSFFARPKPKIVVPRSFFAPKPHENACYSGYLASASRGSAIHGFLVITN